MNDYLIKMFPLLILFVGCGLVNCYTKAWVAYKLGDRQTKIQGRFSWNPLHHLDIFGSASLLIFYVGWMKPMQYNYNDLGQKRYAPLLIELSGVGANLAMWIAGGLVYLLLKWLEPVTNLDLRTIKSAVEFFCAFNVFFALFNLLPIPQLPGFKLLVGLLYHKPQGVYDSMAITYMGWTLIVILIILTPILSWLISASSIFLKLFGMIGRPYFAYFTPFIGGY
ncbi:MAG TPA: site-2 protease family protein [Caldisericia bacterium]|nr:site-2 protease family protein [Caldisericia bacterium]